MSYSMNKEKYLENYIYNSIVNHALKKYKTSIHENDVIKEIIYTNYKKYKTNKYDILKLYLSNKGKKRYINKYKIDQAITNINKELEEAIDKFKKLFKEYQV